MSKQPKYKIDNSKLTRLVEKAKRGNQKALDEVVNMISGYINYYSLTILGDEEQAKDAVQDILLTMLKKIDSLEDPKAFLGWIKTVTANHCKTKLTRSKDNISLDDGTWELADCSDQICPSKAAETKEVCALVREAVKALPQLLRESVMMFYFNQMSVRQIADILEVNENTVKSRLYSARKTMKKYLEQHGGSALASCAIPPMSLLSFSLIEGAEQQQGILIPYVAKSGEVKLASVNPAPAATAASTIPIKAVIAGAACLAIAGVVGTAAVPRRISVHRAEARLNLFKQQHPRRSITMNSKPPTMYSKPPKHKRSNRMLKLIPQSQSRKSKIIPNKKMKSQNRLKRRKILPRRTFQMHLAPPKNQRPP